MNMDASPDIQVYCIYIGIVRPKQGYPWECFSNSETTVKQIEKQTEAQSSFNKDSGNKEQNF